MIKKFLARILVAIMLICGTAFTLSACSSDGNEQSDSHTEQSTENGDDKNDDSSDKDSNDDSSDKDSNDDSSDKDSNAGDGDSGVWTPPAKQ